MNKLKLNEKLINILLYVIGSVSSNQLTEASKILTKDYVKRLSLYLRSIGQYGDTPMLVPEYSSSEFPQSFARTSCVLLSIYIVNTLFTINQINIEDKAFKSVELSIDTNPICGDKLFYGADYAGRVLPKLGCECKFSEKFVLQMVCIVTRPIIGTPEVSVVVN
jgi:RAB protein geranylgeranyltransferase component A